MPIFSINAFSETNGKTRYTFPSSVMTVFAFSLSEPPEISTADSSALPSAATSTEKLDSLMSFRTSSISFLVHFSELVSCAKAVSVSSALKFIEIFAEFAP